MNKLLTGIIAVLIILGMASIASAGLVDSASNAISDGIEDFLISIADDIFGMSFSGYDNTAGYGTVGYIYNIASYTPDPFKSEITQDFIVYSKSIFISCYPILLLCAFLAVLVTHYKSDWVARFGDAMGVNVNSMSNILAKKAFDGIIVAVFMYIFIFFVFKINDILTKTVMISIVDVVSPTADNVVLYFMMAVSYLVMGFFFSARTLVLYLFCGFALLVGFGLLIDYTKDTAIGICAYFTQTVFFQFIIVLYFSACIIIIKTIIPAGEPDTQTIMYLVMLLGGIYLGVKMMFGTKVIRFVGKTAAHLV